MIADAVNCAKRGQKVPQGFYNIEFMINAVLHKDEVLVCGTCLDARGIADDELIKDVNKSTMQELSEYTLNVDKVLVF